MIYNIREFNSNGFLGYVSEKKVYFSFYDKDKNGSRISLGCYPVQRTIIHEVRVIEVEL